MCSVVHLVGISLLMKLFIHKGMKVHVRPMVEEKVFTSFSTTPKHTPYKEHYPAFKTFEYVLCVKSV